MEKAQAPRTVDSFPKHYLSPRQEGEKPREKADQKKIGAVSLATFVVNVTADGSQEEKQTNKATKTPGCS